MLDRLSDWLIEAKLLYEQEKVFSRIALGAYALAIIIIVRYVASFAG